jgi:hypothetical protein
LSEYTCVGSVARAPRRIRIYVAPAERVPGGIYSCGIPAASAEAGMSSGPDACQPATNKIIRNSTVYDFKTKIIRNSTVYDFLCYV